MIARIPLFRVRIRIRERGIGLSFPSRSLAMATLSLRSLIHSLPSLPSRFKSPNHPSPRTPFANTFFLTNQKPLPTQITPLLSPRITPYASAPYPDSRTQFEEHEGEQQQQEEEEEEVIQVRPRQAGPKRLKKDLARLYVGNIPFSTTSNDLSELFTEAGTVASAEVPLST